MDKIKIIIETPVGEGNASCEFQKNGEMIEFHKLNVEEQNYALQAMYNFTQLFLTKG